MGGVACDASRRRRSLPAALAAGAAEALAAFGDGAVYLEREVRPARHIEVQLLGDADGTIVALGERDCSIQRRHQKLVEESPAPGLTPDERAELHDLAIRAARAAKLHNAATAEFLFDTERRFWFLEVNARLQVEHGVTELVTDLDLVAEQLWIAAGAPLSESVMTAAANALTPTRHAIEVRLAAEDPARAFAPSPGRVGEWRMPSGPGVRVDTALRAGERVPPDYDPLIAKIMTVGPDRGYRHRPDATGARRSRGHRHPDDAPFRPRADARPRLCRGRDLDGLGRDALGRRGAPVGGPGTGGAGRRARRRRASPRGPSATTATGPSLRKDGSGSAWRDAGRRQPPTAGLDDTRTWRQSRGESRSRPRPPTPATSP